MQVSRNYLASLQQLIPDLDELGVEVVAVSADGRERAEAFVRGPQPHICLRLREHRVTMPPGWPPEWSCSFNASCPCMYGSVNKIVI